MTVEAALRGSAAVLVLHDVDAIVNEHRGWLLRLCERRLGGDRHLAEDVVQETFVKLSRALGRGEQITNVRAWLRTVAQHGTVDELRRVRSVPTGDLPEAPIHDRVSVDGDPELETAWRELTPRHREVLRLRELEGLRYDEIATAMATGVPAVETLLFRARAALRREYSRASAAVTTAAAPMQAAIGPLRPSRWESLWRGSAGMARGAEAKLAAVVTKLQVALAAGADHALEVAGGLAVGGVAVASLLQPAIPAVPPLPAAPTVEAPVPVPTTLPAVPPPPVAPAPPPLPASPSTSVPPPAVPVPAPSVVTEPAADLVEAVLAPVTELLDGILDPTARNR